MGDPNGDEGCSMSVAVFWGITGVEGHSFQRRGGLKKEGRRQLQRDPS